MRLARIVLPVLLAVCGLSRISPVYAGVHPLSLRHTACVCAADFDHDGLADHGTLSSRENSTFIQIALTGRSAPLNLHTGGRVLNVAALDIDRDGDTDLVALRSDFRLRVWLNNGRGEFVRRSQSKDRISFGGNRWARDSSQVAPWCCSNGYDDVVEPSADTQSTAVSLQPIRAGPFDLWQHPHADPFLDSLHPRPPPSLAV